MRMERGRPGTEAIVCFTYYYLLTSGSVCMVAGFQYRFCAGQRDICRDQWRRELHSDL